ncbi:hypothetical protein ABW19_dt0203772 [Dactylella cylindrospora]|nr:hypothetical protein ABW19_dt0203772 [Dactylella cylindrospora]
MYQADPDGFQNPWIGEKTRYFNMDKRFSDMIVYVGETSYGLYLHRVIVCAKSGLFEKRCDPDSPRTTIELPDIKRSTMLTVVRNLYTDKYDLVGYEIDYEFAQLDQVRGGETFTLQQKVMEDFIAAEYLEIPTMKDAIVQAIVEDLSKLPYGTSLLQDEQIEFICCLLSFERKSTEKFTCDLVKAVASFCDPTYIGQALKSKEDITDPYHFLDALEKFYTKDGKELESKGANRGKEQRNLWMDFIARLQSK